jgi:hypothetical protein
MTLSGLGSQTVHQEIVDAIVRRIIKMPIAW